MPTVSVNELHVVAMYVTDLARSEAFYHEHLGFEKCEEMPPGVLMKSSEVTIYLEEGRQPRTAQPGTEAEMGVCFGCASVKAASEAMAAAGISLLTPYQEFAPAYAMFQINDPDGNLIEFAGKP